MRDHTKPEWAKPTVLPLGGLASGRGVEVDCAHKCGHGTRVSQVCGNGSTAQVKQCKSGNVPPSGSCSSGNQGN